MWLRAIIKGPRQPGKERGLRERCIAGEALALAAETLRAARGSLAGALGHVEVTTLDSFLARTVDAAGVPFIYRDKEQYMPDIRVF